MIFRLFSSSWWDIDVFLYILLQDIATTPLQMFLFPNTYILNGSTSYALLSDLLIIYVLPNFLGIFYDVRQCIPVSETRSVELQFGYPVVYRYDIHESSFSMLSM